MKRLIFRLSSLGDVILSQSILEPPYSGETDWVVAKEFEQLVMGNPRVQNVWSYDRKVAPGLRGWIALLRTLRAQNYTEVLDAHSTLRTWIARIYFLLGSSGAVWRKISKERLRRFTYGLLKRVAPRGYRPTHLSRKAALLGGGSGNERPNLKWITGGEGTKQNQIAIVPSSAWRGKEWPTTHYLKWISEYQSRRLDTEIILLGTSKDFSAVRLADSLTHAGVPFQNGIGRHSLIEVAKILQRCQFTVGSDTGLLHLSESVGTPVVTLFGPTRADYGFGPVDPRSTPAESSLWCSPCSKDGSLCFRIFDRYACLKRMDVSSLSDSVAITEQKLVGRTEQLPSGRVKR